MTKRTTRKTPDKLAKTYAVELSEAQLGQVRGGDGGFKVFCSGLPTTYEKA